MSPLWREAGRGPRTIKATDRYSPHYPWWTRADHDALLAATARVPHTTVLEFGPGVSTLTFLVAGSRWVDTFETRDDWYDFHRPMFRDHRATIHLHLYRRRTPLFLPQVQITRYDLAFVDGPRWSKDRAPELAYARDRCRAVICHDFWYPEVRQMVSDLFSTGGWRAEQFTTQPGEALALLTRPYTARA